MDRATGNLGTEFVADARSRAARVMLMVFDIDGVFTDGRLHYGLAGDELKTFHVHDGHGVKMLQNAGIAVGVISGRTSAAAAHRMRDLGVEHVALGVSDKPAELASMIRAAHVDAASTGFMGDDWVDLAALKIVGFAATVPNAARGVVPYAHWVATRSGGEGAVRDVCEYLLDARGALDATFAAHLSSGVRQG